MFKVTKSKEWDPLDYFLPTLPLAPTTPPLSFHRPSLNTRNRTAQQEEDSSRDENQADYILREVALGGVQGRVRFLTVPLNSSNVSMFKQELKGLLEDPTGLAEQLDQFLRPAWDKMQSVMTMLFTPEERQIIWMAGMQI